MSNLAHFGFWTCAALYAAIGVMGLCILAGGSNAVTATAGYGVLPVAAIGITPSSPQGK